eukprot:1099334-Lingulodinium_polyedra.AAC.1
MRRVHLDHALRHAAWPNDVRQRLRTIAPGSAPTPWSRNRCHGRHGPTLEGGPPGCQHRTDKLAGGEDVRSKSC